MNKGVTATVTPFAFKNSLLLLAVEAFYFEDDRSCAVVAAGDHHFVVIHPAVHDRSALWPALNSFYKRLLSDLIKGA